ncbi:MAG: TIGR04190 family B12-binding domain/radical SAM domain protein [bacterium]|nr:TIGR04190 family B12-binding domain/radical SAM domain protein [bacterium]
MSTKTKDNYKYDLVLLHAPSVYDFRKSSIMYGPISDVVPSTPIFEMYPIGFTTISRYLTSRGFRVRIVNLALKMLHNPKFDVEKFLRKMDSRLFGIDLHWLPHAHGSIEVAKLVKNFHPDSKVVFGGLSATYYHKELMEYPSVDYCIRGDSTEALLEKLIITLKNGESLEHIPNLCWRDGTGNALFNPFSYVPNSLEGINIDYKHIFLQALKNFDFSGYLPFINWVAYPIAVIVLCRGCNCNCKVCGGSKEFYKNYCNRKETVYKTVEDVGKEIKALIRFIKGPIFLVGDIFQNGREYTRALMKKFAELKITNQIIFEFFVPPDKEQLKEISEAVPNFNIQLSLQSHDEKIRRAFGRPFGNVEAEEMIEQALELGVKRLDLFFMTGLPEQTRESIRETVKYCDYLLSKYANSKRMSLFISPLAPFIDPGSMVFENPDQYGYKIFYKTLEEHRQALLQPSWKYILNYETKWLSRHDIVESSYEAGLELNRLKFRYGLVTKKEYQKLENRILKAIELCSKIDKILIYSDESVRNEAFANLKRNMDSYNVSTICDTNELEWSTTIFNIRVPKFVRAVSFSLWSFLARVTG